MRNVIDITAIPGYEVEEVSAAKTEAVDIMHQEMVDEGEGFIHIGDRIVESLIAMGWRPTSPNE